MDYRPRVVDAEIAERLARTGAVLVEGPKACGKTASARRACASEIRLDIDPIAAQMAGVDPALLLEGSTPRLLDEWQTYPALWNLVRHAVDDRQQRGQFLLTGSANPVEDVALHPGTGRISRLRMRPMSLWESGDSTGEVSLEALLHGDAPRSAVIGTTIEAIARWVAAGGWPGSLGLPNLDAAASVRDYVDLLVDVDVSRVSGRRRDPAKVRRLLRSLARHVATEASISTLARDLGDDGAALSRDVVMEYLEVLDRLMVIEDVPAWAPHLRSAAALRKAPKRHFVDPSLAVAALGSSASALETDLRYLGLAFESLVMRDLRVYSQAMGGSVSHYRDANGREVDAVVQLRDGSWAAFEVKLGPAAVDDAAAGLLRFAADIETERTGRPLALTVVTGWGFAHRRPDGVDVVPIGVLSP